MWKKCLYILVLIAFFRYVASHGCMVKPPQRGVTNGFKYWGIPIYDKWARTGKFAFSYRSESRPIVIFSTSPFLLFVRLQPTERDTSFKFFEQIGTPISPPEINRRVKARAVLPR